MLTEYAKPADACLPLTMFCCPEAVRSDLPVHILYSEGPSL